MPTEATVRNRFAAVFDRLPPAEHAAFVQAVLRELVSDAVVASVRAWPTDFAEPSMN
jgi:hypothetical protein